MSHNPIFLSRPAGYGTCWTRTGIGHAHLTPFTGTANSRAKGTYIVRMHDY